jgi:hypothetical protein
MVNVIFSKAAAVKLEELQDINTSTPVMSSKLTKDMSEKLTKSAIVEENNENDSGCESIASTDLKLQVKGSKSPEVPVITENETKLEEKDEGGLTNEDDKISNDDGPCISAQSSYSNSSSNNELPSTPITPKVHEQTEEDHIQKSEDIVDDNKSNNLDIPRDSDGDITDQAGTDEVSEKKVQETEKEKLKLKDKLEMSGKGIAMDDLLKRVTGKSESKDAKESSETSKLAFEIEDSDSNPSKSPVNNVEV